MYKKKNGSKNGAADKIVTIQTWIWYCKIYSRYWPMVNLFSEKYMKNVLLIEAKISFEIFTQITVQVVWYPKSRSANIEESQTQCRHNCMPMLRADQLYCNQILKWNQRFFEVTFYPSLDNDFWMMIDTKNT